MNRKIVLFGATGKMGLALTQVLEHDYALALYNSLNSNVLDLNRIEEILNKEKPAIIINSVAYMGIDQCEVEPEKAFSINAIFPFHLAKLANDHNALLIQFSTDAVFNDSKDDFYDEDDCPAPVNVYGMSKYAGEGFVRAITERYYVFRLPVLFGQSIKNNQFVEKMLLQIKEGASSLNISTDVVSSPSYSLDIAKEVRNIIEIPLPYGTYHLANDGKASLYELMGAIIEYTGGSVDVKKASHHDFPAKGKKNTSTPIRSVKRKALRPWRKAVKAYCNHLNLENV